MQKRNYNSNNQSNNSSNSNRRPNIRLRTSGGGRPRPVNNSNVPGEQRDVGVNPKHRRQTREYNPINIEPGDPETYYEVTGILELHPNGYGFLRDSRNDYTRFITDPFVPASMIDRYGFREGVELTTLVQPGTKTQGPRVREALSVDGVPADDYATIIPFDERTPINPEEWLRLETGPEPLTTRVMDILTPLGKGQRALIVAPPRSGKTVLLHHISQAVVKNHPDVKVIILLVDERPEEVTEFRRAVNAEVVASSLDREVESHVRLSQLVLERCRRLAERGKDVFLLIDSITRLARAFNKYVGNTGRTMSGGVDIKAMDVPKKLFAAARACEGGGSLTIVGTALIETGSRMDDLIFQEFKGTGNTELVLDRKLAEQRIYPAIDIELSGTRREEKLFPAEILRAATLIRRTLSSRNAVDAMERLTSQLGKFNSNAEFFYQFLKSAKAID